MSNSSKMEPAVAEGRVWPGAAILDQMPDAIIIVGEDGKLLHVSGQFTAMFGYSRPEAIGRPVEDFMPKRFRRNHVGLRSTFLAKSDVRQMGENLDLFGQHKNGEEFPIDVMLGTLPSGIEGRGIAVVRDVSERRKAQAKIAHMARHDALTDLPNRVLLRERMEQTLTNLHPGARQAIFYIDLDRFKNVNDTFGHQIGDALLNAVSDRMKSCVRKSSTVARLGGDEFVILDAAIDQSGRAGSLAQRLIDVIASPYHIEGNNVVVGASVGIALAPTDGTEVDMLLEHADLALSVAKSSGRGAYRFFERSMKTQLLARNALKVDLDKALPNNELELLYQPLINLAAGTVSGFEALLRWRHPVHGMVMPSEFISIAEEDGIIDQIGEWAIREACIQAASWPSNLSVAINVSPVQFRSNKLVTAIVEALEVSRLPPDRLELEITESILFEGDRTNQSILKRLRDLGVKISMDDFGAGCSSLSHLKNSSFDKIKIDRLFADDLESRPKSTDLYRSVVGLGAALGVATAAEGIENSSQLDIVREAGCTEAQGNFICRPISASDVRIFLGRFESDSEKVA